MLINSDNNPFDRSKNNFKPLILDGSMGSYLQEKGFAPDNVLWMTKLNQMNPDVIIKVHEDLQYDYQAAIEELENH